MSPIKFEIDVEETFDYVNFRHTHVLADLTQEIDTWFLQHGFRQEKISHEKCMEQMIFSMGEISPTDPCLATPMSKNIINESHFHEIAEQIYQRMDVLEIFQNEKHDVLETIFSLQADIIQGEFEKDLQKFNGADPRLNDVLVKHQEVFGELHPPQRVKH